MIDRRQAPDRSVRLAAVEGAGAFVIGDSFVGEVAAARGVLVDAVEDFLVGAVAGCGLVVKVASVATVVGNPLGPCLGERLAGLIAEVAAEVRPLLENLDLAQDLVKDELRMINSLK